MIPCFFEWYTLAKWFGDSLDLNKAHATAIICHKTAYSHKIYSIFLQQLGQQHKITLSQDQRISASTVVIPLMSFKDCSHFVPALDFDSFEG